MQEDRLWQYTVPKNVLDSLSLKERNRQENIFELIYTEQDFVNDLAYVEEVKQKRRQEYLLIALKRAGSLP